jgi:hypothetical protein
MSKELAKSKTVSAVERRGEAWAMPAGVVLDSVSLEVREKLDFEAWQGIGANLRKIEGGVMWWLGDWLRYGEAEHGEKYSQALDATDYAYQTLNSARWVAERVEAKRRRKGLTWGHHREVAALEAKEQDKWLAKAEKEGWTVKELRNAAHPPDESAPPEEESKTWTCAKVAAVIRAKSGAEALQVVCKALDPGSRVKIKAGDLEEWPKPGEFVRFVVEF